MGIGWDCGSALLGVGCTGDPIVNVLSESCHQAALDEGELLYVAIVLEEQGAVTKLRHGCGAEGSSVRSEFGWSGVAHGGRVGQGGRDQRRGAVWGR